jgi:hypothetical protein
VTEQSGPPRSQVEIARHHLLVGLVWGGLLALGFGGLLLGIQLIQALAESVFGPSLPWHVSGLPVPSLVLALLVGGTTAGVVLGVLLRHDREVSHWIVIGFLMVVPSVLAVRTAVGGLAGTELVEGLGVAAGAIAMGAGVGLVLRISFRDLKLG